MYFLDHLSIPQDVLIAHIDNTMLIRSGKQEVVTTLDTLARYVYVKSYRKFSSILAVRAMLYPFQGEVAEFGLS